MGTITRTTWTDDDGTGTTGTIINNAQLQAVYDAIDAEVKSATNPTVTTKSIIDLVTSGNIPGIPRRIKSGSGTSTSAVAATVDSIVLPVLTALDSLMIEFQTEFSVNGGNACSLHHVTDGASLATITNIFNADEEASGVFWIRQGQKANTQLCLNGSSFSDAHLAFNGGAKYNATATWPSAWTLGLRFPGIGAGGTFRYNWRVFVLPGQ